MQTEGGQQFTVEAGSGDDPAVVQISQLTTFGWWLLEKVSCKRGEIVGGRCLYDQAAGGDIEYLVGCI